MFFFLLEYLVENNEFLEKSSLKKLVLGRNEQGMGRGSGQKSTAPRTVRRSPSLDVEIWPLFSIVLAQLSKSQLFLNRSAVCGRSLGSVAPYASVQS